MRIAIASGKGGAGKTSVAASLASVWNSPLVAVDTDVEAPNLHLFLPPQGEGSSKAWLEVPSLDLAACSKCGKCREICSFKAIASFAGNISIFPDMCHGCGGCFAVCADKALKPVGRELGELEHGTVLDGTVRFLMGRTRIGESMTPPLLRQLRARLDAMLKEAMTQETTTDENGNVVDGDLILYVCGKYLKETGRLNGDAIVTTVMSNLGLYKACDKVGMKYEKTAVGDKYVYENMVKNNYSLGGEQSGHIIFSKHATTGDGILTSLMIMEVMLEKKMTLGQLTEPVRIYPQLLKNVRVTDKKTARENPAVQAAVNAVAETLGDDGRILVRESGTEPVIRVMVEATTDELCEKYVDQVIDVIRAEGLVVG